MIDTTSVARVQENALDGCQARLVDDVDSASELMRWLGERRPTRWIGFDTETTGLSPETDRVRLVQVGDLRTGWAIPFERWGGVVEDVLRRYKGRYVMHNAPYDVAMMRAEGIEMPTERVDDTRPMAHVLSSTESLALKNLAARYVDPRAAAAQEQLDEALGRRGGWTWETVPVTFAPYWRYAALDPILTVHLAEKLYPLVMAEAPRSYELELAVAWVCERMARRGVRVNREYTQSLRDQLARYSDEVATWCRSVYSVNPGSDAQVVDALLRDGVQLTKMTPGGTRYSLDKEVISQLEHPLAQAVYGRRKAVKMLSTYLEKYLELSKRDGLVHPSINTIGGTARNVFESGGSGRGVRTGRMSISDPSLQNVPVRTDMGKKIRKCFQPHDPTDGIWVKCDADQIEMRILTWMSGDQGMVDAFRSDGDFFVNMARQIFNEPDFQKSDPRRQQVKNSGYAKIYGAGAEKFAWTAGMLLPNGEPDVAAAVAFLDTFDRTFPGVRRFQDDIAGQVNATRANEGVAYVRSPLTGRKHTADAEREYAVANYLIQGTAGEVLKLKIVELDAAGLGEYMLFPVHDEIDFDPPRDELPEFLHTLTSIVNDDKLMAPVPITWSPEVGPNWGECS